MPSPTSRGLPPHIYLPVFAVIAVLFIGAMFYFLRIGFANPGASLGEGTGAAVPSGARRPQNVGVGGGPPPAVQAQLGKLRAEIAAHPTDDVALVQLADMYLAVQKYEQAVPLYKRALKVNPKNVAAQAGLEESRTALAGEQH